MVMAAWRSPRAGDVHRSGWGLAAHAALLMSGIGGSTGISGGLVIVATGTL